MIMGFLRGQSTIIMSILDRAPLYICEDLLGAAFSPLVFLSYQDYCIQIPAGYKYSTILVASSNVTGAMRKFGEVMRRLYSKTSDYRRADYSINYLG